MYLYESILHWIIETKEMCNEVLGINSLLLPFAPGHLKIQGMCERVVEEYPHMLRHIPDHLKIVCPHLKISLPCVLDCLKAKEMCKRAIEENPYNLQFVRDQQKTHEMWDDAVRIDPYSLPCPRSS